MGSVIAGASVVFVSAAIAAWVATGDDGDEVDTRPRIVGPACTLIGCSSGASVALEHIQRSFPEARRLVFCVGGSCSLQEIEAGKQFTGTSVATHFDGDAPVEVELILLGRHSRTLHRVRYEGRPRHWYPNGRQCDKGCLRLDLYFDEAEDALRTPPLRGKR